VRAVRHAGLPTGVVSSSTNCRDVVAAAGLEELFDARVDAIVAAQEGLAGKPAPDMFVACARRLGFGPDSAAVFEDALVGVEAGRAGRFALVVGVDRVGQRHGLEAHGADVVVTRLTELLADG
jgi:HAD superfamily hydrolase (TIGR01509 family)